MPDDMWPLVSGRELDEMRKERDEMRAAGERACSLLEDAADEIVRLRSWIGWLCGATSWAKRQELAGHRDHILTGAPPFVGPPVVEADSSREVGGIDGR